LGTLNRVSPKLGGSPPTVRILGSEALVLSTLDPYLWGTTNLGARGAVRVAYNTFKTTSKGRMHMDKVVALHEVLKYLFNLPEFAGIDS
jgi:hypothetical protein